MRENIYNIPNLLTMLRVVTTFVIGYIVFWNFSIVLIAALFIFGMLLDLFDGIIARQLKMKTEFGRNFDVVADRFLMLGAVLFLLIKFWEKGLLNNGHFLQITFVLSREIICFFFVILAFILKGGIPQVRFIGKLTTFLQAVTFPAILLSVLYPFFGFSFYLSIITGIVGIVAAFYYIKDIDIFAPKKFYHQ